MRKLLLFLLVALVGIITGCSVNNGTKESELTVSAAASLQEALEEVKETYSTQYPDINIVYNFGGSGSLQQQISQGAPVDLFISAAQDQFDTLQAKKLIDQQHTVKLLKNELVLITQKNNKNLLSSTSLTEDVISRIAIGTPETVPAGMYAKQAFVSLGLWEKVEPKLIRTKDVRQVLTYVETGNVEAGIVYKTDAMISDQVRIIPFEEEAQHDPILYPAGVISGSKHKEEASKFLEFLRGKEATKIFEKYGFQAALE
ncbi:MULTISPECIES: molybdate ABC transporter substrate-binding protein [Mesobacillus]|uniref:Molybdenum ABC transporter substrate-binding protein n=2 Tax=Mesobacillus TaxID=2675231 RepID=A0A0D6ZBE4_9BACI|nr:MULTISPECIES: molybdate ABC transporter substrate-binding protein [Mesobacillus]KIY22665.1 molybdenum ABC transporter substrate-binding protein [Mesobacillus subterraneus]MDQ0411907.1 molybdate transport system substrate-binding protein [Mesobacillus stamsii]